MRTFLNTAAAVVVIAAGALGGAYLLAPVTVASGLNTVRDRLGLVSAVCTASPVACVAGRVAALKARHVEVREARGQAELGLRAIEAEEIRLRNLADANLGQQALLRTRVNDAAVRGAERVSFQSRSYTLNEAGAQAASLVAEAQQFDTALTSQLPPRREALLKARQEALLVDNSITSTIATAEVDRALLLAGQSMDRTNKLLADISGSERRAVQTLSAVRSTLELAAAERAAKPAPGAAVDAFDFSAWRNGRAGQGG